MHYIIIFSYGSRDSFLAKNMEDFIIEFAELEHAIEYAKTCIDNADFREYKIIEET